MDYSTKNKNEIIKEENIFVENFSEIILNDFNRQLKKAYDTESLEKEFYLNYFKINYFEYNEIFENKIFKNFKYLKNIEINYKYKKELKQKLIDKLNEKLIINGFIVNKSYDDYYFSLKIEIKN